MKDKYSWISALLIISGFGLVYVGTGSMEAETLDTLPGTILAGFGLIVAIVGGLLLKINELH